MKWVVGNMVEAPDGQKQEVSGIYVFWFVADNEQTVDNIERMWWLARDLLCTGVLQRWAYVSYFSVCAPGQENAAFERMERSIAAAGAGLSIVARQTLTVDPLELSAVFGDFLNSASQSKLKSHVAT